MAGVGTGWKRADGYITEVETSGNTPFDAANVKYKFLAAFVLGGQGTFEADFFVQPKRSIPDDSKIETPASVGDPCTVTIAPDGTINLYITDNEIWSVDDCP